MLKKIFNIKDTEKPKKDAPEDNDTDTEAVNENIEEVAETVSDLESESESESEINDASETADDAEYEEEEADEFAALNTALTEMQDKYLRLAAEFDNYRKRTLREKADLIQTAGESLLSDILPLVDDFERGIEVATAAEDMEAVKIGMGFIYNKLKDFLTNHGVKEIMALHEPFDADWHEAITNIPAPSEEMKGIVLDVIQKGYMLNSKVMRYPKVVVGE